MCQVKASQLTLFAFGDVRRVPILTWQEGEVLRRDLSYSNQQLLLTWN